MTQEELLKTIEKELESVASLYKIMDLQVRSSQNDSTEVKNYIDLQLLKVFIPLTLAKEASAMLIQQLKALHSQKPVTPIARKSTKKSSSKPKKTERKTTKR